jgi:hypothetical protein
MGRKSKICFAKVFVEFATMAAKMRRTPTSEKCRRNRPLSRIFNLRRFFCLVTDSAEIAYEGRQPLPLRVSLLQCRNVKRAITSEALNACDSRRALCLLPKVKKITSESRNPHFQSVKAESPLIANQQPRFYLAVGFGSGNSFMKDGQSPLSAHRRRTLLSSSTSTACLNVNMGGIGT